LYVCNLKAHILCDGFNCRRPTRNECGICRKSGNSSSLSKAPVNCLTKLIENIPFSACNNYQKGCTEICELSKVDKHQSICEFRSLYCKNIECSKSICCRDFIDHMKTIHGMKQEIEFDRVFELDLRKVCYEDFNLLRQRGTGHRFIVCICHDNDHIFLYTYYLGLSEKAKDFSCSFKIVDDVSEISYKGQVYKLDESIYSIIRTHKCMVITQQSYKTLMKEGKESLDCIVEIIDLKEDAKDENDDSGLSSEEQS